MLRIANPFTITRAVDLSDEEIQSLWVDVGGGDGEAIFRPTSPLPLFLLGGKGSGKTHWMRYYSYPLQRLRYVKQNISLLEGIAKDRYIGIYVLLSGLNAERFSGRSQNEDVWRAMFAYFFELWIAQELLHVVISISESAEELRAQEAVICKEVSSLLELDEGAELASLKALLSWCAAMQRDLDSAVNNAIFTGSVSARIRVTPGNLIFGLPRILSKHVAYLSNVLFSYQLDEFENISESQQRHVNTLIRERRSPATFRIGGRSWGVKTHKTFSDDEENKEGSEFETKVLDNRLREDSAIWKTFAYKMIQRRIAVADPTGPSTMSEGELDRLFSEPDLSWRGAYIFERIGSPEASKGAHFDRLRNRLESGRKLGVAPGVSNASDIEGIIRSLTVHGYPILEKINMLLLFQGWYRQAPLVELADDVARQCALFLEDSSKAPEYGTALQHYASDMLAQLLRDFKKRQLTYYGMKSFVRMAEGLPRSLIVILRQVFDWAIHSTRSDHIASISTQDQEQGVLEAADWFMETMRKAGPQGTSIRTAIERLARLFEVNRFSDKPIECSLLGFSVRERDLQPATVRRLMEAEQRSFLIRISNLEIERNTGERISKFQLNATLSPKWSLPIARRGIARFKPHEVDLLFDPAREKEFDAQLKEWRARMTAPRFGRAEAGTNHPDLFGD